MLLVFRFIEQEVINAREKNKGGANLHTLIIADEAHLYIDPKFPIALDFFYSMSKRIRKYNGSFIPATQNIADWNANEELRGKTSAIIKNSQYSFIFKLSAPDMKDVLDIYKAGDSFNDEEQRMIISAVTGQTFFVGSTELRSCLLIKAGDYTQKLFDEKTGERREELEGTYNRLFNRTRLPSYDGSYLKFPEMNPAIELKPHQKNAVHRIITGNSSTLLSDTRKQAAFYFADKQGGFDRQRSGGHRRNYA